MKQNRLRGFLVVTEIALSVVLMVGAGLLIRSFERILSVPPGFEPGNLMTMMVPATGAGYGKDEQVAAYYRNVIDRVHALPGVEAAGIVSVLPFSANYDNCGFFIEEKPLANPAQAPSARRYVISPDYLRAMGIPLLRGRPFNEHDDANAPLRFALISKTKRRQELPPIGQMKTRLGSESGWAGGIVICELLSESSTTCVSKGWMSSRRCRLIYRTRSRLLVV